MKCLVLRRVENQCMIIGFSKTALFLCQQVFDSNYVLQTNDVGFCVLKLGAGLILLIRRKFFFLFSFRFSMCVTLPFDYHLDWNDMY